MVFDPPKPKRRAIRWFVPVLLVVIALVALSASGAGTETRDEIDYLNEMSSQIEQLAMDGDALRDVVSRLSRIDRQELVTVIDRLRADLSTGIAFVGTEPPSDSLIAVRSLYRLALDEWNDGIARFGSGILAAADNPDDTTPTDTIANGLVGLRAGDSLFTDLLDEVDRIDVPDPITPFRSVVLSPADGEAIGLAVGYTNAARNPNNGLSLRPGLAVSSLVASPDWQLNPDDQVVMPFTDTATFSVIVTNVGNLISPEEQLTLTLTGTGEPTQLSLPIPPLDPGEQTTITFDPVAVVAGELHEVKAEIVVSDIDSDFEDNVITVLFRVNTE